MNKKGDICSFMTTKWTSSWSRLMNMNNKGELAPQACYLVFNMRGEISGRLRPCAFFLLLLFSSFVFDYLL